MQPGAGFIGGQNAKSRNWCGFGIGYLATSGYAVRNGMMIAPALI